MELSTLYELRIQTPDGGSRTWPLEGERGSVGRAHGNDLCYPEDGSLSRRHLLVEREGADWTVRDLGSKNGTLLNGVRLAGKERDHVFAAGKPVSSSDLSLRP